MLSGEGDIENEAYDPTKVDIVQILLHPENAD